jgi:hypothetical protein
MFCLATKILTYLPFFYLIIFMTSNCQDALGSVHNSSRGNLLAQKRACCVENARKVSNLASIFNAAGAFLSQKIATR